MTTCSGEPAYLLQVLLLGMALRVINEHVVGRFIWLVMHDTHAIFRVPAERGLRVIKPSPEDPTPLLISLWLVGLLSITLWPGWLSVCLRVTNVRLEN